MPRPPLAQPLFFFSLLLVLGGAAGAVGSFWWTARWHDQDEAGMPAAEPGSPRGEGTPPAAAGPAAAAALPLLTESEWENRAGWRWLIEPRKARGIAGLAAAGAITFSSAADGLDVFLARAEELSSDPLQPRFAAAAFGADGEFLAAVDVSGSATSGGVALRRFRFWPADAAAEDIAHVGVEVLTPDAWRAGASAAQAEALAAGIRTLPFPEIDAPYPFELEKPGGGTLTSADYRGRVVLFDCWASWCAPCMAKMPDLRAAYAKYHPRGLEIVGINLDMDPESATQAIAEHAPDWPHVRVGTEDDAVKAWQEVTTIRSIPRFFLVDRQGILRWDSTNVAAEELTRAIEECLAG
jgi:thiol-disulfide isomerase/thioredoxin